MITHKQLPSPSAVAPAKRRWTRSFAVAAVLAGLGAGTIGGAHAGSLITSRQIKDNSLLSKDLHNGTLTGRDVRDGRLAARDFDGDATGPTGNPGPTGPTGPAGMHDVTIPGLGPIHIDPLQQVRIQVDCTQGYAVSGGLISGAVSEVLESSPDNGNRSWSTWAYNPSNSVTIRVTAFAVCAQFNLSP
jgi:hypothetical protein